MRNFPKKEFWITNTVGWIIASFTNIISQYLGNSFDLGRALLGVIPMFASFLFTSSLRVYWGVQNIYKLNPMRLILVLIPQSFITTLFIVIFGVGSIILIREYQGNIPKLIINNFLSLYFIVLLWIAIYFVVIYYSSLRNKEIDNLKLQNSLQQALLINLKNQLNPHFLFNALNNIRSLIKEDGERAREMISALTDILRYSINSRNEQKIYLLNEIDFIKEYLRLEHLHMEDRLDYKIEIEDGVNQYLIPPMSIQLLVENAIKHGSSESECKTILVISAKVENNHLVVSVCNNGKLQIADPTKNFGIGLSNIKDRLKLLYDNRAAFELKEVENFVYSIIHFPLEKKNESTNC